jgi:hypothetical protein
MPRGELADFARDFQHVGGITITKLRWGPTYQDGFPFALETKLRFDLDMELLPC